MSAPKLPIHAVLPDLLAALAIHGTTVLVAPPGAGKTTSVAPALIGEDWCTGQVILLSPRRVAARAAAERIAEILGERAGETVGYLTRMDSKSSAKTRILVMTEGIFVNRITADPELAGVSAVLFDEAHERHLDSDLGLALALESREVLREDLRICVMSATIDGARFARLLGDKAPVIESEGKAFPLEIRWLGASPEKRIEDAMAEAVLTAWRDQDGDILAFLPGVREIERTRERLEQRLSDTPILPLHGQVDPAGQRAAIRRDPEGRRRIVLATAIAETSLTLDGVSVVVDSGLSRHAEFDRAAGTTHLVTRASSQASAGQRAGRAARQRPGTAYRLWNEAAHAGRPEFDPPEIETSDLAPLVLSLANWGTRDPSSLKWLDPLPQASLAAARARLTEIGALDEAGKPTSLGEQIGQLPVEPHFAVALLLAAERGQARDVAEIVLTIQTRGLGGRGEDLFLRWQKWSSERTQRAKAWRSLARNWGRKAHDLRPPDEKAPRIDPARFFSRAQPSMLARRRDSSGQQWQSVGGRGFTLDPASPLARAKWIFIADAQGMARGARITAGLGLHEHDMLEDMSDRIERRSILIWNESGRRIEARQEQRLGAITLKSGPDPNPDPQAVVDMLVDKAVGSLGTLLPPDLMARARFAGLKALSEEALAQSTEIWLKPLLEGRRDLDVASGKVIESILGTLSWDDRQRLDREAPRHFASPAGTRHAIDYTGDDAPSVEVRVQALFGLDRQPMIGNTPLLLKLTSPAGRPIQSTRDMPGFWRGSWLDVRKDMKGRYPKHRWPDEPWTEKPSLKTKNAFSRSGE